MQLRDTNSQEQSPDLEAEFSISMTQFKVGAVGRDHASSVRPGGQSDWHIEVQAAKLLGRESCVRVKFRQQLAGLKPVGFRGSQDGMIFLESAEKFKLRRFAGTSPHSANTTEDLRIRPVSERIRGWCRAVRKSSTNPDVSKTTISLIGARELQFARIFLHQVLESL